MAALCGDELSRRGDTVALVMTVLAIISSVVAPMLYVLAAPVACGTAALAAPAGRRSVMAVAVWLPVSAAVVIGLAPAG